MYFKMERDLRCKCLTQMGNRCSRRPSAGSKFCFQHQRCRKEIIENDRPITKKTNIDNPLTGKRDTDIYILSQLDDKDLANACRTNKYINQLCKSEKLWKSKIISKFGHQKLKGYLGVDWRNYYNVLHYTPTLYKLEGEDLIAKIEDIIGGGEPTTDEILGIIEEYLEETKQLKFTDIVDTRNIFEHFDISEEDETQIFIYDGEKLEGLELSNEGDHFIPIGYYPLTPTQGVKLPIDHWSEIDVVEQSFYIKVTDPLLSKLYDKLKNREYKDNIPFEVDGIFYSLVFNEYSYEVTDEAINSLYLDSIIVQPERYFETKKSGGGSSPENPIRLTIDLDRMHDHE